MAYSPKVVAQASEAPGTDFFTHSATGPFVDTGLYHQDPLTGRRFGRIILSRDTILHLASLFEETDSPQTDNEHYSRGYLDGLRDTIGPDLVRSLHALGRHLDRLSPLADTEGIK